MSDKIPPELSDAAAIRINDNDATVTFTSNEPGVYYILVSDKKDQNPEIDMSGLGLPLVTGQNTIPVTGLTAGAKYVYIKAKDVLDNETVSPLEVPVPASSELGLTIEKTEGGAPTLGTDYLYGGGVLTIQGGVLTASPTEADVVKNIYTLYLSGLSYSKIAEEMMRRGVHYHAHTVEWNKHMVKRIIENQKYLGADGYPRLVADEDFLAAQHLRQDKNTYAPCPAFIEPIREKCRCGACGSRMTRDTKSHGRPRWLCENDACGNRKFIPDEELRDVVAAQLSELALAPHLLRKCLQPSKRETSLEPVRLQNQINYEFNRADTSPEYLRVLILACFNGPFHCAAIGLRFTLGAVSPHFRVKSDQFRCNRNCHQAVGRV